MSGQKEAIIQKYSPVIIYITISEVILNIQQFMLTKIKNIWKEMMFFLWGNNDAGHTDRKGRRKQGWQQMECSNSRAKWNCSESKYRCKEIMSLAFAAVECSSGVKLRNIVKGLLLRGLLRLMALLQ